MSKFGIESKIVLYGITVVCIVSLFSVFGISTFLAKNFQQELIRHDYGVAGYLLNHKDAFKIAAFTAEKSSEDIANGSSALSYIGYNETVSIQLFPTVLTYRNDVRCILFILLFSIFGAIYILFFFYMQKQHKVLQKAEISIRDFLEGNPMARIESERTGDWHRLFHMVNELSSILSAHAEQEKQTKEFLQNMISDVSHQIKTPLSALKMYQEIIENSSTNSGAVSSFSQKSLREIKRMEDVIDTLLKLARLDAGIIIMQKAPENISNLMQDVLERFAVWAERENKTITLIGKEDIFLNCDALWMSEAVGNILKNALEHTAESGQITIRWEQTPLITQITVEDNGKGIHPEDLYNIFKRFYRSRFSQEVHGIGLGLPLAKTIIESHGGTLSVVSRLDLGTTFTIHFCALD